MSDGFILGTILAVTFIAGFSVGFLHGHELANRICEEEAAVKSECEYKSPHKDVVPF